MIWATFPVREASPVLSNSFLYAADTAHSSQLKSESLNSARACDDKEAFNVRNHSMSWHGTPAPFQPAAESFYATAVDLAERVMEAAAIALNLPLDFFTSRHAKRDLCTLRFLHYPPLSAGSNCGAEATATENIRAGKLSDASSQTISRLLVRANRLINR